MPQEVYCEVSIGITGEICAELLQPDPQKMRPAGSVSNIWPLERALSRLAEGAYFIDLRPLAEHSSIVSWAVAAPLPNGHIEGTEIEHLSERIRGAARELMEGLGDAYQQLAYMAANKISEPVDGSAGPFDYVSSAYLALYWHRRGARVGKRVGQSIRWMDGFEQRISEIAYSDELSS